MDADRLWAGTRKGGVGIWVYDPALVHDDPGMVYLFRVERRKIVEYPRDLARSAITAIDESQRALAVDVYLKWHREFGVTFVAMDRQRKAALVEKKQQEAIARHIAYLRKHKKPYAGVTKESPKQHRATHCYKCQEGLDSSMHIECNACGWLFCYCGACGCGFEKRS